MLLAPMRLMWHIGYLWTRLWLWLTALAVRPANLLGAILKFSGKPSGASKGMSSQRPRLGTEPVSGPLKSSINNAHPSQWADSEDVPTRTHHRHARSFVQPLRPGAGSTSCSPLLQGSPDCGNPDVAITTAVIPPTKKGGKQGVSSDATPQCTASPPPRRSSPSVPEAPVNSAPSLGAVAEGPAHCGPSSVAAPRPTQHGKHDNGDAQELASDTLSTGPPPAEEHRGPEAADWSFDTPYGSTLRRQAAGWPVGGCKGVGGGDDDGGMQPIADARKEEVASPATPSSMAACDGGGGAVTHVSTSAAFTPAALLLPPPPTPGSSGSCRALALSPDFSPHLPLPSVTLLTRDTPDDSGSSGGGSGYGGGSSGTVPQVSRPPTGRTAYDEKDEDQAERNVTGCLPQGFAPTVEPVTQRRALPKTVVAPQQEKSERRKGPLWAAAAVSAAGSILQTPLTSSSSANVAAKQQPSRGVLLPASPVRAGGACAGGGLDPLHGPRRGTVTRRRSAVAAAAPAPATPSSSILAAHGTATPGSAVSASQDVRGTANKSSVLTPASAASGSRRASVSGGSGGDCTPAAAGVGGVTQNGKKPRYLQSTVSSALKKPQRGLMGLEGP